jgi:hypothetical protein
MENWRYLAVGCTCCFSCSEDIQSVHFCFHCRRYWELEMFYSIMTQLSVSLPGALEQGLLMVLVPTVST